MHGELETLSKQIAAAEADAAAIAAGLSDAQANWQPGGGAGWSVAQCLAHLAKINPFYLAPFLRVAEQAAARGGHGPFVGVRPTWFGRRWVRMLEPPVTMRAKAPGSVRPAPAMPIAEALATYLDSHTPYRRLLQLADNLDVNRLRAPNPFINQLPVRLATALLVVPAHDRRHLWQARRVLETPGFPR